MVDTAAAIIAGVCRTPIWVTWVAPDERRLAISSYASGTRALRLSYSSELRDRIGAGQRRDCACPGRIRCSVWRDHHHRGVLHAETHCEPGLLATVDAVVTVWGALRPAARAA